MKNENGSIIDPYSLSPKLFQDINISKKGLDLIFCDDKIKGGGAASIAYSRLQDCKMREIKRKELILALLKYCELHTLAMAMMLNFL